MNSLKRFVVQWLTIFRFCFSTVVNACGTPVTIPASPFMKKLGCGTGVSVYLMNRYDRLKCVIWSIDGSLLTLDWLEIAFRNGKQTQSPWAIKKISSKCAKTQQNVYQKRLCEEAKILKELQHPNIVGNYIFYSHLELYEYAAVARWRKWSAFRFRSHWSFNPAVALIWINISA